MDIQKEYVNSQNTEEGTPFPLLVLHVDSKQCYPQNQGFRIMHWHEDLQFVYVQKGSLRLETLNTAFDVSEGEGVFINKNRPHLILGNEDCCYRSFIFPEYFLSFYAGSPVTADCISPYIHHPDFECYHFRGRISWEMEVLGDLKALSEVECNPQLKFPRYQILLLLHSIWLCLISHVELAENPDSTKPSHRIERIEKFLQYIQNHYAEEITITDIAKSAHVSKAECLRCFHEFLHSTPYNYLIELRISKSMELLKNTDLTISRIALMTGFNHPSYFTKTFKEKTGITPKEYRKVQQ